MLFKKSEANARCVYAHAHLLRLHDLTHTDLQHVLRNVLVLGHVPNEDASQAVTLTDLSPQDSQRGPALIKIGLKDREILASYQMLKHKSISRSIHHQGRPQ